jgi:hypothetical protein
MASTKKIEFYNAFSYIHHDGTDLKICDVNQKINLVSGGDIVLDSGADIVLDASGGNIEFSHDATTILTLDLDTAIAASAARLTHHNNSSGASVYFNYTTGTDVLTNAISINNGGYGGWANIKHVTPVTGAWGFNAQASPPGYGSPGTVEQSLPYSGCILKLAQQSGDFTITLPTVTSDAEAKQLMGWHFRAHLDTIAAGDIIFQMGDTNNDYLFGHSGVADGSGGGSVTFSATDGTATVTFNGNAGSLGDYVEFVCVSAAASGGADRNSAGGAQPFAKWLVTGHTYT